MSILKVLVSILILLLATSCERKDDERGKVEFKINEISAAHKDPEDLASPFVVMIKYVGHSKGHPIQIKVYSLANGAIIATESSLLAGSNNGQHKFSLNGTEPWSAGRYLVEVSRNGALIGSREIDVYK